MLVGRVVAGLRRAERRDLEGFGADVHVDEPEPAADQVGPAEQWLDLFREGVGGEVEILGLDAEQQVAHGAAHDERLEAGFLQPARDLQGAGTERGMPDRVVAGPVHARRAAGLALAGQQAGDQSANHRRGAASGAAGAARAKTNEVEPVGARRA